MLVDVSDQGWTPHAIDVVDPNQDLDGNGVDETVVVHSASLLEGVLQPHVGDESMAVLSDFDGDGRADHITTFDDDGGYAAWELSSGNDTEWNLTDRGSL